MRRSSSSLHRDGDDDSTVFPMHECAHVLLAASNGDVERLKELLSQHVNQAQAFDNWAIKTAAARGHADVVEFLLQVRI